MDISNQGKSFLQALEGCKLEAYQDCVGIWTIGYGSTFYLDGSPVEKGDIISEELAEELFDKIVDRFASQVGSLVRFKELKQHEFDALVSFCYNVGANAFASSSVLKAVLYKEKAHVVRAFFNWLEPIVLLGRRKKEADLYLEGDYVT